MAAITLTNLDLTVRKGITFSQTVTGFYDDGTVANLSGYVLSGYARYMYSSTGNLLSLNPSGVNSSGISGLVNLSIIATGTNALPVTQALYDVKISSGNYVDVILAGKINVIPLVTY